MSLFVFQYINKTHTMITPDLHLQPLYYGQYLALLLMPLQWMIEAAFRRGNSMVSSFYTNFFVQ